DRKKGEKDLVVLRSGELEKWNTNLLQLWRRLELWADGQGAIQKVDCIGQMSKNMYFTTITSEGGRNFCCPRESCWNNSITLALIHFQSKCALQHFKIHGKQGEREKALQSPDPERRHPLPPSLEGHPSSPGSALCRHRRSPSPGSVVQIPKER
uniref:Uncharacterized protein n=1 Tax=Anolis carolinensis TaxID=28377 RepID=A0A803SZ69_ANOCA